MYMCEIRKGSPTKSSYVTRKWVPIAPQKGDLIRIGAQMYTVDTRYIGTDDHVAIFIKPEPEISGNESWVFPVRRKYARENK